MKYVLYIIILILNLPAIAQNSIATVEFEKLKYDFGTIQESAGDVSHTFAFKNIGDKPFIVNAVNVTCGCTTPVWDKAPLMPGKGGTITITFDPIGRPGVFEKHIIIMCNTERKVIQLTISGNVQPRPRTIIDDYQFPIASGLRITERSISMGNIPRGTISYAILGMANNSENAVTIAIDKSRLPSYIDVSPAKTTIQPHERSEINIKVDATKIDKWGLVEADFSLIVNGISQNLVVLVRAILVENFQNLTSQQLRNAPHSYYSSYFHHFSDQPKGAKLEQEFYVSNSGTDDLIIRNLDFNTKNVKATISSSTIKKGQTATIKITLQNTNTSGRLAEVIRVITNDPEQPMRDIRVMATIK